MPAKQQEPQQKDHEKSGRQQFDAALGSRVLRILGQPGDLCRVQVRLLWADRYRVNVFVGSDVSCARIAHSYFLVADADGNILASAPNLIKQY